MEILCPYSCLRWWQKQWEGFFLRQKIWVLSKVLQQAGFFSSPPSFFSLSLIATSGNEIFMVVGCSKEITKPLAEIIKCKLDSLWKSYLGLLLNANLRSKSICNLVMENFEKLLLGSAISFFPRNLL